MNEQSAWSELLDAVKNAVPQEIKLPYESFKWVPPNRVLLSRKWQVQARFTREPHRYSIFFERLGAELGRVNYEPTPWSGEPKQTVWTMLLELSAGEVFWRFSDGQTLKSDVLARRVIGRLPRFHDEYGMRLITPNS